MIAGDVICEGAKATFSWYILPQVTCAFVLGGSPIQTHAGFGHPKSLILNHPPCLLAKSKQDEVPFLSIKPPQ